VCPLSPRHGAYKFADVGETSCEYIEEASADSGEEVVFKLGGWHRFKISHRRINILRNASQDSFLDGWSTGRLL